MPHECEDPVMAHEGEERVEGAPQWNNSDVTEDVEHIILVSVIRVTEVVEFIPIENLTLLDESRVPCEVSLHRCEY